MPRNYYKCGKPEYHSNVCPKWRVVNLIEDMLVEDKIAKDDNKGYDEAYYEHKDGDRVSL